MFFFERDELYRYLATRLSWLLSFRPVALRPRFSTGLPFHYVDLSSIDLRF
jgi:hypothetical protein